MKPLNCPKCKETLEEVVYKNIVVDRCIGCRGIWFDAGEFKKFSPKFSL